MRIIFANDFANQSQLQSENAQIRSPNRAKRYPGYKSWVTFRRLILRSALQERVSKDVGGPMVRDAWLCHAPHHEAERGIRATRVSRLHAHRYRNISRKFYTTSVALRTERHGGNFALAARRIGEAAARRE